MLRKLVAAGETKTRAQLRNKKIICKANFDSCRTFSPAAVQLRKLVAAGEISPGGGSTR